MKKGPIIVSSTMPAHTFNFYYVFVFKNNQITLKMWFKLKEKVAIWFLVEN